MSPSNPPVIIIGAPRSGTNILRDTICRLPGLGTWPCDEINPIWRHGNAGVPHDALAPALATDPVRRFIRTRFERLERVRRLRIVVEKTCANSLRVPFVDAVFPSARYLFVLRRPEDAVASAMLRWRAPFDLGYTLRKVRYTPLTDLPRYALRGARARLRRAMRGEERLSTWGPRPPEATEWSASMLPAEICARQWHACVQASVSALRGLPPDRVVALTYEQFVASPREALATVRAKWGLDAPDTVIDAAVACISPDSVGKGAATLADEERRQIETLTTSTYAHALRWVAESAG